MDAKILKAFRDFNGTRVGQREDDYEDKRLAFLAGWTACEKQTVVLEQSESLDGATKQTVRLPSGAEGTRTAHG